MASYETHRSEKASAVALAPITFLDVEALELFSVIGFDGYLRHSSRAWKEVLGYTDQELSGLLLRDLLHTDDREQTLRLRERIVRGETVRGIEARVRAKDGTYKWLLWHAIPLPEQRVYVVSSQDITEHKAVEQRLRESQDRFQLIASATREAVWDWDLRADHVWRNDAFLATFGAPDDRRESPVAWWRDRIHPEDRERVLSEVPKARVDGQQRWVMEYRLRRADGTYAFVYDRGFTIFDGDSEPVRIVGSIIDISAVKSAEQQLRESEERFRLAATATNDVIWDWDIRRGTVWRSDGLQTLFGYDPATISPDMNWWSDRIHPDDRQRVLESLPPLSNSSSEQCAFAYRFRKADGSYADVQERGFVIYGPDGKATRMVGSLVDVSERRRAEEMAHIQRAELAHIARISTMGEIATGLAHELNQPLAAIMNYAESCRQALCGDPEDPRVLAWLDKIVANTQRAGEMIRRLRGFTRKGEPRRSTVEVNDLVREVFDLLEAETRVQNVRLLWEGCQETHVTVDRVQIQQVLVNLLRNAYEAMEHLEPPCRQVVVTARANRDRIEIAVADTGEGIPPENHDRVFDAFFTSKPSGVGIGLAISRSIVEAHGGRLWLAANDDVGVTFSFTLPLAG